jgi:hypothetical protein
MRPENVIGPTQRQVNWLRSSVVTGLWAFWAKLSTPRRQIIATRRSGFHDDVNTCASFEK